ncbi:MAG: 4Fe-4S cluster-binding domain-containing protein [Paramuribaculum sp.]|nr:4Fe-4S cluster-binding domain-containing protein [Paramuribaculum sp.]
MKASSSATHHKTLTHNHLYRRLSEYKTYLNTLNRFIVEKPILEIHAADHCNLNCCCCSHYSPIAPTKFCDLKNLEDNLKKFGKATNYFKYINILGGEPLLNPEIDRMIKIVRKYFPHTKINLVTNGILLLNESKLPHDFWKTCRENRVIIKVTKYPIKLDYDKIVEVCRVNGAELSISKNKSDDADGWLQFLLKEKGWNVKEYKIRFLKLMKCHYHCLDLVDDKLYPCPIAAYANILNDRFGTTFRIDPKDYIEISQIKSLSQLKKFMILSTPFCRYCPSGRTRVKWKQSECVASEWCVNNTE